MPCSGNGTVFLCSGPFDWDLTDEEWAALDERDLFDAEDFGW